MERNAMRILLAWICDGGLRTAQVLLIYHYFVLLDHVKERIR